MSKYTKITIKMQNPIATGHDSSSSLPTPFASRPSLQQDAPPSSRSLARTLPSNHLFSELDPLPKSDYKDKMWTEIDVLDDVKKMAADRDFYHGFPQNFEEQISRLRSLHVTILDHMRQDHSTSDPNQQTETIHHIIDSIEDYNKHVTDQARDTEHQIPPA